MCNEIRELNDRELDNITGGGFIDDVVSAAKSVWTFLTDDSNKYDPVKACPQCYAGGGHGVRG
jgi:bacteriocin-like protein